MSSAPFRHGGATRGCDRDIFVCRDALLATPFEALAKTIHGSTIRVRRKTCEGTEKVQLYFFGEGQVRGERDWRQEGRDWGLAIGERASSGGGLRGDFGAALKAERAAGRKGPPRRAGAALRLNLRQSTAAAGDLAGRLCHSQRRAAAGSMRTARRAGMQQAARAVSRSKAETVAKVTGSVGWMP